MEWLKQSVVTVKRWRVQYWLSERYRSIISPRADQLDDYLNKARQTYKHDRTTTVAKVALAQTNVVLKRYNARTQGHKFKRALRRSRARRCWLMSYEFANAGLNVAAPILMYERRAGLLRKTAYFASEFLAGEELLHLMPSMSSQQRQGVLDQMRDAFNQMRLHKISHGDMKASNLLWINDRLYFIDLDAATKHRFLFTWSRSHKKDRRRFLKNWQSYPDLLELFARL